MAGPPRDRSEFRIRFGCAFLFFGLVIGFSMSGFSVTLQSGLALWTVATLSASVYAAGVGDQAWVRLIRLLSWH